LSHSSFTVTQRLGSFAVPSSATVIAIAAFEFAQFLLECIAQAASSAAGFGRPYTVANRLLPPFRLLPSEVTLAWRALVHHPEPCLAGHPLASGQPSQPCRPYPSQHLAAGPPGLALAAARQPLAPTTVTRRSYFELN